MTEQKKLPIGLADVLDRFVAGRIKNLEKSIKDAEKSKKDPEVIETYRTAIGNYEKDPYGMALKVILGWNPKTGRNNLPKIKIGTHLGKFISAKSGVAILSLDGPEADGFVRSGNTKRKVDLCLNAADSPTGDFLLDEADGTPMYEHIIRGDEIAKALCSISDDPEQTLEDLRNIMVSETTDMSRLKQVHFPVGDGFHLLSPLNGAMMFALTDILEDKAVLYRKGEKESEHKKRKKENGNIRLDGLWLMHYGSSQPQNVSILNKNYSGNVLMLPSLPPRLSARKTRLPKKDFFADCITYRVFSKKENLFREEFDRMNKAILVRHNNKEIREIPFEVVRSISTDIAGILEETRNALAELDYKPETDLPAWQNDMLESKEGWFETFARELAVWIHNVYAKKFGDTLGDHAIELFEETVLETKEEYV